MLNLLLNIYIAESVRVYKVTFGILGWLISTPFMPLQVWHGWLDLLFHHNFWLAWSVISPWLGWLDLLFHHNFWLAWSVISPWLLAGLICYFTITFGWLDLLFHHNFWLAWSVISPWLGCLDLLFHNNFWLAWSVISPTFYAQLNATLKRHDEVNDWSVWHCCFDTSLQHLIGKIMFMPI
jgi:hypothetical protein